jgi:diamine N-acetyltransferase
MDNTSYLPKGIRKKSIVNGNDEMRKDKTCKEIFLSFDLSNIVAKKVYTSVGFEDTGKVIDIPIESLISSQIDTK